MPEWHGGGTGNIHQDMYVHTDTGALINKYGITDPDLAERTILERAEPRVAELLRDPVRGRRFGPEQLCEAHRRIFQDSFEWAGQIRNCTIDEGMRLVYARPDEIMRRARIAHKALVKDSSIKVGKPPAVIAQSLAKHWHAIHRVAMFRTGNFLAQRVLIERLLRQRGIQLNLTSEQAQRLQVELRVGRVQEVAAVLQLGIMQTRSVARELGYAEARARAKRPEMAQEKGLGLGQERGPESTAARNRRLEAERAKRAEKVEAERLERLRLMEPGKAKGVNLSKQTAHEIERTPEKPLEERMHKHLGIDVGPEKSVERARVIGPEVSQSPSLTPQRQYEIAEQKSPNLIKNMAFDSKGKTLDEIKAMHRAVEPPALDLSKGRVYALGPNPGLSWAEQSLAEKRGLEIIRGLGRSDIADKIVAEREKAAEMARTMEAGVAARQAEVKAKSATKGFQAGGAHGDQ